MVFSHGGALRRLRVGVAGPLADLAAHIVQVILDLAVDVGLGLGGDELRRQGMEHLDLGDLRFHQAAPHVERIGCIADEGQGQRVQPGCIGIGHVEGPAGGEGLIGPFL